MTTLERVRAEIDEYLIAEGFGAEYRADITRIIDKYAEQEPCDDVVSRQAIMKLKRHNLVEGQFVSLYDIEQLPSVRPQEQTGKCRTCKYGEIYNDLWCKCHDPLLNGVTVKMTEKCRAEEIIDLNRKYREERSDKE